MSSGWFDPGDVGGSQYDPGGYDLGSSFDWGAGEDPSAGFNWDFGNNTDWFSIDDELAQGPDSGYDFGELFDVGAPAGAAPDAAFDWGAGEDPSAGFNWTDIDTELAQPVDQEGAGSWTPIDDELARPVPGATSNPDGSVTIQTPKGPVIYNSDGSVVGDNTPTAGTNPIKTLLDKLTGGMSKDGKGGLDPMMLMMMLMMLGMNKGGSKGASQATIPQLNANRSQTPYASRMQAPGYRPGQGGNTYFNPTTYAAQGGLMALAQGGMPAQRELPPNVKQALMKLQIQKALATQAPQKFAAGGAPFGYSPDGGPLVYNGTDPKLQQLYGDWFQQQYGRPQGHFRQNGGGQRHRERNNKFADGGGIGRLLSGPGDGVSDSIPAHIDGQQPAAIASGEFIVPARAVSELGNGSTEAGARQLYAMVDRIQKARGGTVGKDKVAVNSKAVKHLPA